MNVQSIKSPEHAGSREQAKALIDSLAENLSGQTVILDFTGVLVSTPSFVDELVKQVLEQRHASILEVAGASERARQLLVRAATNRDVQARLVFDATSP